MKFQHDGASDMRAESSWSLVQQKSGCRKLENYREKCIESLNYDKIEPDVNLFKTKNIEWISDRKASMEHEVAQKCTVQYTNFFQQMWNKTPPKFIKDPQVPETLLPAFYKPCCV